MDKLFNALDESSNTCKLKRLALTVDAIYRPGASEKATASVSIVRHSIWSSLQHLRLDFFNYKDRIAPLFRWIDFKALKRLPLADCHDTVFLEVLSRRLRKGCPALEHLAVTTGWASCAAMTILPNLKHLRDLHLSWQMSFMPKDAWERLSFSRRAFVHWHCIFESPT